jgi:hypothetical protein
MKLRTWHVRRRACPMKLGTWHVERRTCPVKLRTWHVERRACPMKLRTWHVERRTCPVKLRTWHVERRTCPMKLRTWQVRRRACPMTLRTWQVERRTCPMKLGTWQVERRTCPMKLGTWQVERRTCPMKLRTWQVARRTCPVKLRLQVTEIYEGGPIERARWETGPPRCGGRVNYRLAPRVDCLHEIPRFPAPPISHALPGHGARRPIRAGSAGFLPRLQNHPFRLLRRICGPSFRRGRSPASRSPWDDTVDRSGPRLSASRTWTARRH